jgi:hypothetical protein
MELSRRSFLKFIASLPALSVPFAFSAERDCYVELNTTVNYIGHCPGGFVGSSLVKEILPFDGTGYPVVLEAQSYWFAPNTLSIVKNDNTVTYYDFELSNFLKDVPSNFWHDPENCRKYNNVHTYIRVKRYGETVEEAIKQLNFVSRG